MKTWIHKTIASTALTLSCALSVNAVESQRFPGIEGASNFRDLGGYQTTDGHTVKWGKIYRSNALDELTDADQDKLIELGVTTVCDLREPKEYQAKPDRIPEGATIEYINLDIQGAVKDAVGKSIDSEAFLALKGKSEQEIERLGDEMMEKGYAGMALYGAPLYGKIFRELLDNESPVLVYHCQAGKDRAGIASALVLLALGVDEETVIKDYMISQTAYSVSEEEIAQYAAYYGVTPIVLKQFMGTKENWIQSAFQAITKQYGSFEAYFHEGLGLSNADLSKLRSTYLN